MDGTDGGCEGFGGHGNGCGSRGVVGNGRISEPETAPEFDEGYRPEMWVRRTGGLLMHDVRSGPDGSETATLGMLMGMKSSGKGKSARRAVVGLAACVLGVSGAAAAWGQTAPRYQSPFGTAPSTAPSLPTPASITPGATVVEDVVVRVNDQIISRSDVERSQKQLEQELQQNNASPTEREQRQRDLLRDMIDQQLLLSRGKELGLNADAEVVRRLDEIRKQNHLESMEDLEKAARSQGVSFEDFKAQIRNNAITQQVVRDEVGQRLRLSPSQEQTYYDAHKQDFQQPEQVRLSEILVPTPENATEAQVAQAQGKAEAIAAQVKAGGDFAALAKKDSGGPTAAQGGDLGLFKRGALAKVLEDQTFDLPVGQATAPIRTRQGFVVLKLTKHQAGGMAPLKQVEPQVQEAMYMEQMQPALRAYLTKLRENAYIDVKPGFVDSGASSKQTKPVFSAYAPPAPKKKSVLEKSRFDRARVGGASAAGDATSAAGGTTAAAGTVAATPDAGAKSGKTRSSAQPVKVGKNGKVKIRKEKVRYGQAPRNALPPGPEETVAGVGAGTSVTGATDAAGQAPGAALAPTQGTTEISSTSDENPLTPRPVSFGKTRFSSRAPEVKAEKVQQKQVKVAEKEAAMPAGPTTQEVATQKTQAAPLGLNGDTVKKKKVKRKKGETKERIQDRPGPVAPIAPSPTVNPDLGKSLPGTTSGVVPSADRTTLPLASAPPPGVNSTGQPIPPAGSPEMPPGGAPVPSTAPPTTTTTLPQ